MRVNLRRCIWVTAIAMGISIGAGAARAAEGPFFQEHEQDYSKNKNYEKGVREGRDDQAHNRDHSKKRQFKKSEDQKAYEAGYQKGRGN